MLLDVCLLLMLEIYEILDDDYLSNWHSHILQYRYNINVLYKHENTK